MEVRTALDMRHVRPRRGEGGFTTEPNSSKIFRQRWRLDLDTARASHMSSSSQPLSQRLRAHSLRSLLMRRLTICMQAEMWHEFPWFPFWDLAQKNVAMSLFSESAVSSRSRFFVRQ